MSKNMFRRAIKLAAIVTLAAPGAGWARSSEVDAYVTSAESKMQKGDLRGAEIEFRNAIQRAPDDGDIRLELGSVYLLEGNPPAAEASVVAARERGVPEERYAGVLAEALYNEGEFGKVLDSIPDGNRDPKVESLVRMMRGLAQIGVGEAKQAETELRDAERLNPQSVDAKVAMSHWLLVDGQYDAAAAEVDAAVKIAPNDVRVLDAKGAAVAAKNDMAGALEIFDQAVKNDPNYLPVRLSRANVQIAKGDIDDAQKDVTLVLSSTPGNVRANYLQALIDVKQAHFDKADAILTKDISSYVQIAGGYYLAGIVKYNLGQYEQAAEYLNKYNARQPNEPDALYFLGATALRTGDTKRAVEFLEQARNLAPANGQILGLLGQAYAADGKNDLALGVYEQALKQEPDSATLQTAVAATKLATGDTTSGLTQLDQIFKTDKGANVAGPPLILSALKAGDTGKAANVAAELYKHDPNNVLNQELFGITRAAQHDYAGAEPVFRTIVEKNPDAGPPRRNLAQIYVALNRIADAKNVLQEGLKRNPDDVANLSALAQIDIASGNTDEAIELLRHARDLSTSDSAPGLRLVAVYAGQKNWKDAVDAAHDLQTRFPKDVNVFDMLARVQTASGDLAGGLASYKRTTEIAPNAPVTFEHYALALMNSKNYTEAAEQLKKAIALAPPPSDEQYKLDLMAVEYKAGGLDGVQPLARSFDTQDPDGSLGEVMLAEVLGANGKADAALPILEKTFAHKPSARIVRDQAQLYLQIKQPDRAIAVIKDWLAGHPDNLRLHFTLANILLQTHKFDEAQANFEQLNKDHADDPIVLNDLAWLYQRKGDGRARPMAERAYQLSPRAAAVADTYGWILTSQGGAADGLKYLKDAGAAEPQNFDIQYHLAVALQKTGDVAAARTILKQIVNSTADFDSKPDAKQLLEQLGAG